MRAIVQPAPGGIDTLSLGELPVPVPGPGQLLVRVRAAGVNRADLVQREGHYPPPPGASPILGLEISGEIAGLGRQAEGWQQGQAVFGLVSGGGYAEYALLDADCAIAKPDWLSHAQAAGLPEAWMTACFNLQDVGQLQAGETVLIHAGASGVGAAAIQLGKLLGARVCCTVGSEAKAAFCTRLGADSVVERSQLDFATVLRAQGGADLILDCIGGAYLEANLACLNRDGRLVMIGLMGGVRAEIDLGRLLVKRLTVRGSTLRSQPTAVKAGLARTLAGQIMPALASGRLQLTLDRSFTLAKAGEAHAYLQKNANLGKVVLLLD